MEPVVFDWNTKTIYNDQGFIAEDMSKVLPNIVSRNEDGQVSGMDYSRISPVLVAAIQEQHIEIEDLNSRLRNLEEYIKSIR